MRLIPIILLLSIGLLLGCEPKNTDRQGMMNSAIQKRVERFRKGRLKLCRDKVMKEANIIVDSLLVQKSDEIRAKKVNVKSVKPVKPHRPNMPEFQDTISEIAPLFDDSIKIQ